MNSTVLKLIGIASMTIDHIGYFIFPQYTILRVIGRLAYPIFAYMIAEGCRYTKNKKRYLGTMLGMALICAVSAYITEGSLFQSIFTTFSCSIIAIYLLDDAIKSSSGLEKNCHLCFAFSVLILFFIIFQLRIIAGLKTDYGFLGIITPVFVWLGSDKKEKLIGLVIGLLLIITQSSTIQWYSLAAIALLYLYNGKRGRRSLKWFFYGYYPLHIAVIYGISQLVS